jgi:hypothetical protein
VPDEPAAAASPPLEALPPLVAPEAPLLLATPLVAPLEALAPVALPDALPLEEAPLVVAMPVLAPEPDELTDPDEPDAVPAEPEGEPLPPEDPVPTVTEGVFELEHARLIVMPAKNNPEHHLADMRPPQCNFQIKRAKARLNAETKIL